ncbi:VENN motif pre-toxin domain-containing protein, partial [Escherichia coli]
TDNLSEQERQQISMLVTIASGIAGGLAGNSTSAAGTGAQAGTRLRIMRWVTRMTSCHPLFR